MPLTITRFVLGGLIALFLSACSMPQRVQVSAVDYNRAVANSNDKILLLNIIRASKGRPLHFTRIGKISGSFQNTFDNELEVPFGGQATNKFVLTPTVTIDSEASFDIQPLNGKNFWQGLLKPLDMKHLAYFWNQGETKELLVHLMIEKAVIRLPNNLGVCRVSTIVNDTKTWRGFDAFASAFVELQPESINQPKLPIGQAIKASNVKELAEFKKLLDNNVQAIPLKGGKVDFSVPLSLNEFDLKHGYINQPSIAKLITSRCNKQQIAAMRNIARKASSPKHNKAGELPDSFQVLLTFRSVAGIINYLGQHTRTQLKGESSLKMQGYYKGKRTQEKTLFSVSKDTDTPAILVQDAGVEYAIPERKSITDKTLTAFSILHQLMGLQIEGGNFQPTQSIRFINQ